MDDFTAAEDSQVKILTLTTPIRFDGREYTTLTLQPPTVKHVMRGDEQLRNGVNAYALRMREVHLITNVTGAPQPVIEQMAFTDLRAAMRWLEPFLSDGQETGAF